MPGIIAAVAAASILTPARARPVGLQDAAEPTIEQELAALIEKTNALETFHVVYDMESTAKEESPGHVSLEIVYVAPAIGHLLASGPGADQDMWLVDGNLYGKLDGAWRRAEVADAPEAFRRLDELFPSDKYALDPGLMLLLQLQRHGDRFDLGLSLASSLCKRRALLGWLQGMQRDLSSVVAEDEVLVWTPEAGRVLVSRSTGFIEAIDVTTPKGDLHLRLQSLTTEQLDESLLILPAEAKQADVDPRLTAQVASLRSPEVMRRTAFQRVQQLLDDGLVQWDERSRSDWQSLLEAIHGEALPQRYEKWLGEIRAWIEKGAESMRAQLDADDSPETRARVREQMESARATMVSKLDTTESKCLESLSPEGGEWHEGLLEIEIEVVRKAYDEVIRQPMFTFFDEQITTLLED